MTKRNWNCSVEGCTSTILTQQSGLCRRHYYQVKRHGNIIETIYEPNPIEEFADYAVVTLKDVCCTPVGKVKIDLEDVARVSKIKWCLSQGYAWNNKMGFMHRWLNQTARGLQTDHINRDRLDNRKINLRTATTAQNSHNSAGRIGTSKYKGVSYLPSGRWQALLSWQRKSLYLGTYDTQEEAALAYNRKALELHGEFAYQNRISND